MKKKFSLLLAVVLTFGILTACTNPKKSNAAVRSQKITETYQARFEAAVPYPLEAMKDSIERRNLRERLLRFNQANKIGYVYLLSQTGSVISFYTIKGKVSSTQSQMTASERIDGRDCRECANVIEAPGDDGSYGPNEDGIFFFTTEDVMVQWNGPYIYADAPLKVTSAPILVQGDNFKPSSTSAG